jgi:hypothetical protein
MAVGKAPHGNRNYEATRRPSVAVLFDATRPLQDPDRFQSVAAICRCLASAIIVRKKLIAKGGLYFPDFRLAVPWP